MPVTLNTAAIRQLKQGAKLHCSQLKGFGCRKQKTSVIFFVQTSIDGKQRFITLGKFGPLTVADARKQAQKILGQVASGIDPTEAIKAHKANPFMADALDDWIKLHGPKLRPRTLEEYKRLIRLHIKPALGNKKVNSVTAVDINKLHASMADKPRAANFALAVLNVFFNHALRNGIRTKGGNPCEGITKYKETKRERYLTDDEFRRLGAALDATEKEGGHTRYVVAIIRLLILTGARLSEIKTLKWTYVDLERARLFLPESKTGNKQIILNAAAIEVIKKIPRPLPSPFVFPSQLDPNKPIYNVQKAWRAIRDVAQLTNFKLHDLRHSFASIAAGNNVSLQKIGLMLGHQQTSTTQRYSHIEKGSLQDINEAIGQQISEAMTPAQSKNNDKNDLKQALETALQQVKNGESVDALEYLEEFRNKLIKKTSQASQS